MLVSIVLQLQSRSDALLPAHLGQSNYSAALRLLDGVMPGLGDRIHDLTRMKPLTCSGLFSGGTSSRLRYRRGRAVIRTGEPYWVRLTGLTEEVSATLVEACLGRRPDRWEAARHSFEIVGAVCQQARHSWSGSTTFEELAGAHFLDVAEGRMHKTTLEFHSPTAFRRNDLQVPLPLPRLVFGSLLERWNAFSPVDLQAEMRAFGEYAVEISRFELKSVMVEPKRGGNPGRVGGPSDLYGNGW